MNGIEPSFFDMLIADVMTVQQRCAEADTQAHRRDLVRTLFAAIEGLVWIYREHVIEAADMTSLLRTDERQALTETAFTVTPNGKISRQSRFIPLPSLIRLIASIAARLDPNLRVRFDTVGWSRFKAALDIRHRLTHPKSSADLIVNDKDRAICESAFEWLLEVCMSCMESAHEAQRTYNAALRNLVDDLKRGDPDTLALYQSIRDEMEN